MKEPSIYQVEEFFEDYGDDQIQLVGRVNLITVEELYQMFKVRLLNEPTFTKVQTGLADHLNMSHPPLW